MLSLSKRNPLQTMILIQMKGLMITLKHLMRFPCFCQIRGFKRIRQIKRKDKKIFIFFSHHDCFWPCWKSWPTSSKVANNKSDTFYIGQSFTVAVVWGPHNKQYPPNKPTCQKQKHLWLKLSLDIFSEISQFNEIQSQREHHSGGPGSRHL